jgi:hypothetical protein
MRRRYVVQMPPAEARHLAGVGRAHLAGMPGACPASRAGADPAPGEGTQPDEGTQPGSAGSPAAGQPVRGPFAPDRHRIVPPGRVEYLGAGTVRLDEAAIASLAGLSAGADFRVIFADTGPVLLVGADRYLATEL